MKRALILVSALLIVIPGLLMLLGLTSAVATHIPAGAEGRYVTVDGLQLRVQQQGQGPDLLLIHGLPGSIEDWDPVIDELASRYRVTLYDRPGHGYSELRASSANLTGNVDMALDLIDTLALQNVIVVGHSYGGTMAAAMATRQPGKVAGYVSVAGLFHKEAEQENNKFIFALINTPVLGTGVARVANKTVGVPMMTKGLRRAFSPDQVPQDYAPSRESMWLTVKSALAVSGEQTAMRADLKGLSDTLGSTQISTRFTLLHGSQDLAVPVSNVAFLQPHLTRGELILLEDVGHMAQFSAPDRVVKAIDRMASKVSGSNP